MYIYIYMYMHAHTLIYIYIYGRTSGAERDSSRGVEGARDGRGSSQALDLLGHARNACAAADHLFGG